MPRLIRRRPLAQRLKDYFNLWDWLLWASEEFESNDWDDWAKEYTTYIGFGLNFVFLLARANCEGGSSERYDDVFRDFEGRGMTGWLNWLAAFIVHLLTWFSALNTLYTFLRKRYYRLFENPIDDGPSTPNAQRVRVDSSPVSSSPLRYLTNILSTSSAESRTHPDPTRDVWELAVWDPLPICLRLFCLFSPGHVLIYWVYLPTAPSNPRPSVTVFTAILLALVVSLQLSVLRTYTSQQAKDAAIIHKEVLNEYDIKFVHPRTRPEVRDVGTQFGEEDGEDANTVITYRPTTFINRGFRTNPNPNYAKHTDSDGHAQLHSQPVHNRRTSFGVTPSMHQKQQDALTTPAHLRDASSPLRPSTAVRWAPTQHQPSHRSPNVGFGVSNGGDGGNLGIYSNARSPLRKSASTNFTNARTTHIDGRGDRESSPLKRAASPLKRSSMPGSGFGGGMGLETQGKRFGHLAPKYRDSGSFS